MNANTKPDRQDIINKCATELATNFEIPASRILAYWGSQLNLTGKQMAKVMREEAK